jgi:hypothetical protein
MPTQDIIQKHFSAAEQAQITSLMVQIETILQPKLQNLDPDENQRYGSINEANKLLVNKVFDYQNNQPNLKSPDVDWVEFTADYTDRKFLEAVMIRLMSLSKSCEETKRMHDFDNYQNALLDYDYSKYKMGTMPGSGYDTKVDELKQFFPNTGGGNSNNNANTPA